MKKYLIKIETDLVEEHTTIHGDLTRPFSIANNLWNYETPGYAARRLELLAKSWEKLGYTVRRVYGFPSDMPTAGNEHNAAVTKLAYAN